MVLEKFLAAHGLGKPDGRPLHAYRLEGADCSELAEILRGSLGRRHTGGLLPAIFVLWASERIRRDFRGGSISWDFVFSGLGLTADRSLAVGLVEDGLRWWRRSVRKSGAGHDLFLFTLMAEGGLPDALLTQATHYRAALVGLVGEIEGVGAEADEGSVLAAARRWVDDLPQAFRNDDGVQLLAELARALAELRRSVPANVPMDAADGWLDQNRPGWQTSLPVRLSDEAADGLIRGILRAERAEIPATLGPIGGRELRRDLNGCWSSWLRIAEHGLLGSSLLPAANGKRLRLIPIGAAAGMVTAYTATPEDGGWDLRRLGGSGPVFVPLALSAPFAFGAFADGASYGEVQVSDKVSLEDGDAAFWRMAEGGEAGGQDRLVALSGAARTRQPVLWLLTAAAVPVETDATTLMVSAPETCEGGLLRRLEGEGSLRVGDDHFRIKTSADADAPQAALDVVGEILRGWRRAGDGGLIILGEPRFVGTRAGGSSRQLSTNEIDSRSGGSARYSERVCIWRSGGETLARTRFTTLPRGVRLDLREVRPGAVALGIEGLPPGLHVRLSAGATEKTLRLVGCPEALEVEVPGLPPGELQLRLWNAQTGAALTLRAAWPSRSGLLVGPDGQRLAQNQVLAVDELRGWRAIAPHKGDLQFSLVQARFRVALPVSGEVPLVAHLPLVRALLAQGGPDAQVNVRLIVEGHEGHRLEIRRYHDHAEVVDGRALFGLKRDTRRPPNTIFAEALAGSTGAVRVSAVCLCDPKQVVERDIDVTSSLDLATVLSPESGSWLIQTRKDGRSQRAFAWPGTTSTRSERIERYTEDWRRRLDAPEDPEWDRDWALMREAARMGDAGALDQVQAIAKTPAAAVALLLRSPSNEKPAVLALELAAPIIWSILAVEAFAQAISSEWSRQKARYALVYEEEEASTNGAGAVAASIGEILRLRPDLRGHFALGLMKNGLPPVAMQGGAPVPLGRVRADTALFEAANAATCRFDRLPSGVQGLIPLMRPPGTSFSPDAQPVLDAPLVAAEVALGRRILDTDEMLNLINLRLVDPAYFDAALPLAIQIGAS